MSIIVRNKSMDGEYAREIGGLVLRFGSLEGILAAGIGMLLNDDPKIGLTVTPRLSFDVRLTVFDALVRAKTADPELLTAHEALLARLQQVQRKRNGIVHAMWVQRADGSDAPVRYRYTTKVQRNRGPIQTVEKTTPEEIGAISDECQLAFHQACAFLVELVERKLAPDHGIRSGDKPTRRDRS